MVRVRGQADGLLEIVEGVGLWLRKRWAEWLTVIATSLLVPFEIYELIHRPSPLKAAGRARHFYEQTLGLQAVQENPGAVVYGAGPSFLIVYPSDHAGTNQATAATWAIGDDFDTVVEDLQRKGVTFERYDLPDTT
jgi:hypothetical protein